MKKYRYRKPYRVKKKKPLRQSRFFRLGVLLVIFLASLSYLLIFTDILLLKRTLFYREEDLRTGPLQPAALWCGNKECFLSDENGRIFKKAAPEAETDLIRVFGEKELFSQQIDRILEIKSKLEKNLKMEIKKAHLVSPKRLDLENSEGWRIYFNLEEDSDWQIQKLGLVLEKQISPEERKNLKYIDLRFSRVYYKLD